MPAWSVDAQVLVRPASTFQSLAAAPARTSFRSGLRRPLFVTFVIACAVSLAATGALTARIAGPSMLYLAYVPMVEALGLVAVIGRRRHHVPLMRAIDIFFAGHAPWTLLIIAITGLLVSVPPAHSWMILTRVAMVGMALVAGWSAYIDFCFFRAMFDASPRAALRDLVVLRAITWLIVFSVLVAPEFTPWGLAREISEAVQEVLR
jgi:hypothetical protein